MSDPVYDPCAPDCGEENNLLLPHPQDCSKYYQCSNGDAYLMLCPSGLYFSPTTERCEYPYQANCTSDPGYSCSPAANETDPTVIVLKQTTVTENTVVIENSTDNTPVEDCKPPCPFAYAYMPHPQDCTKFYVCDGSMVAYEYSCQPGLLYDMERILCDYPYLVKCIAGPDHACDELLQPESDNTTESTTKTTLETEPSLNVTLSPNTTTTEHVPECKPACPWAYAYMPHPQDCTKFYVCDGNLVAFEHSCQPGLLYDMVKLWCDYPNVAYCIAGMDHDCDELLKP